MAKIFWFFCAATAAVAAFTAFFEFDHIGDMRLTWGAMSTVAVAWYLERAFRAYG